MFLKVFGITALILLLLSVTSVAQRKTDWFRVILGLLGEVPRVCAKEISPVCFSCLVYTKFVPLIFFFAIFFLIFYYIVQQMVPMMREEERQALLARGIMPTTRVLTPVEIKFITIMSIIFALIVLNAIGIETILRGFRWWIGILFLVLALLLIRGIVVGAGVTGILLTFIIILIIFLGLWPYIEGIISPTIETWLRLCL